MARSSKISIPISATFDPKGLRAAATEIDKISRAMRALGSTKTSGDPLGPLTKNLPKAAQSAQQAERSMLALARAQAQLAKESGNTAQGAQILQRALAQTTQETTASIGAQRQLNRYMSELGKGANQAAGQLQVLPRTLNGLSGAAADFAKVAAGAFAVERIAAFGAAAIGAANDLEDAKTALKTIAGDTETYNKTLEVAAQNQRLFGGSMASNVESMSGFVISSRLAGVELEQLLDLSQRLATLDPGQGAAGASIALRELLSGNEKSLAMRFELPKQALAAMGDESLTATQKLAALSEFLDGVGVSSEAIKGKLDNNSQSFRDLAAAGDALQTSLGGMLAGALAPVAAGLAEFGTQAAAAVNQLTMFGQNLAATGQNIIASSTSYDEYKAKVEALNAALPPFVQQLALLSPAAYEAAKGLEESGGAIAGAGVDAEEFAGAVNIVNFTLQQMETRLAKGIDTSIGTTDAIAGLGEEMIRLAGTSEANRMAVESLAQGFQDGRITGEELAYSIENLSTATEQQAGVDAMAAYAAGERNVATDEGTTATMALADSLVSQADAADTSTMAGQAQAQALRDAANAAFEQQNAGKGMEDQARAAADALFASGAAGTAAAAELAATGGPIWDLVLKYLALKQAMLDVGTTKIADPRRRGQEGGLLGGGQGNNDTGRGQGSNAPMLPPPLPIKKFPEPKPPKGGGGGKGGGGAGGRANEAKQAQERLQQIAADGAARIAEINRQAAERLVAIDREAAAERARIAAQLQTDLASDAAQGAAANEADDLDLIGAGPKELAKLQAREQAQAEAAQRMADAQARAREQIAAGNAEAAAAEYETAKQAIEQREELDRSYYEKKAELAGNPEAQAALDKEYAEAVKAQEDAAAIEQEIVAAKVAEKQAALEQEKAAVIQAADEQKAEVVKRAQEQAEGVKGASATQAAAVAQDLANQAQAATDWASATESAAQRVAAAYAAAASAAASLPAPPTGGGGGSSGGSGGGTSAAGGLTGVTTGRTTITVGDNPGGMELVQVTPLSGKGQTRVGNNMVAMAGGGAVLAGGGLPDISAIMQQLGSLGDGEAAEGYAKALQALLSALSGLRDLASVAAIPAIDPAIVRDAAQQASQVAAIISTELTPLSEDAADGLSRTLDAASGAVELIGALSDLRASAAPTPIPPALIQQAAASAARVVTILRDQLVPLGEEQAEGIGRYLDVAQGAIDLLLQQRDFSGELTGYRPPLDEAFARALAEEARRVAALFLSQVVPLAAQQAEQAARYADLQGATVATLTETAGLGRALTGYRPPVNQTDVRDIANEAAAVAKTFQALLLPASAQQVTDVERFASLVGAAIQGLTGVLNLRTQLAGADLRTPITQNFVTELALEAQRIAGTFRAFLLPLTEGNAADIERYASAVRASIDGLLGVLNLRRALADEAGLGTSATQQLLTELALEAQRIAGTFRAFLLPLSEQEAGDVSRYAAAVGASTQALAAVLDLRRGVAEMAGPGVTDAALSTLAADAKRALQVMRNTLIPLTEDQGEEVERYTSAVQASIGAIQAVLGLSGNLFADYVSPSDADIRQVALDARRIAQTFAQAAATMETRGIEGAQKLAESITSAVTATRESLLTMQAINDQSFNLDLSKLQEFEDSSMRLYATLERMGARAVRIPAANLAAITNAATALTAQSNALIAAAAVPYANLASLGVGGAGSSTTTTNLTIAPGAIVIHAAPGVDAGAIANQVMQRIDQRVRGHR